MRLSKLIFLVILIASATSFTANKKDQKWSILGPGGGGAQFLPTISPHDSSLALIACDMTGVYITADSGKSWREFNLRNRVDALAFDFSDPKVIYAGSSGLFRSQDRGVTWRLVLPEPSKGVEERMVGDHGDHSFVAPDWPGGKVEAIRVDPTEPRRILAAVHSEQVHLFASEDGAKTWKEIASFPGQKVLQLYLDPASPTDNRLLYLVTTGAIHTVRLAEPKATELALPVGVRGITDAAVGFDPVSKSTVLYLTRGSRREGQQLHTGVFRSRDGGKSWNEVFGGLERGLAADALPSFTVIAAADMRAGTVYVSVLRHPEVSQGRTANCFGIMKSSDFGETWDWVMKAEGDENPSNKKIGWVGRDYGAGWGEAPLDMGVCPTNADVVYATDYGTTYRSLDGGKQWEQVYCNVEPDGSVTTRGIEVTTCYGVHFDPFDRNHIAISYTDIGFFHSFNGGRSWIHSLEGVPRRWINTCYWLAFDPEVPGRAWSVWGNGHDLPRPKMFRGRFDRFEGGVCRTADNCRTWEKSNQGMPENTVSTHVVLDPRSSRDARVLYVAGFGKGVFKSTDGGLSWQLKNNGVSGNLNAWRFTLLPDGTLYLLVARGLENNRVVDGAMYRSTDAAETWQRAALPPGVNAPNDLIFDPRSPKRLYLSCWPLPIEGRERGGGLYRSEDGGATWENIFDESAHVYAAAVEPNRPDTIYFNTFDSAAYRSEDRGRTWQRLGGYNFKWGHRPVPDPHHPGMLYLTTFGSSVWYGPSEGVPGAFEDIHPFTRVSKTDD